MGTADGQFEYPFGVAVDGSGNVFVADTANNRIQKFDGAGNFLLTWGTAGTAEGDFAGPRGIAVDGAGNVFVTDTENNRVQEFNGSGVFLQAWGSFGSADGQFKLPRGIAVDDAGHVYVADAENFRIQRFDSGGTFISKWGTAGDGQGEFGLPIGLTLDASGNVFVTDATNDRIEEFDSSGNFVLAWGTSGSGDGQFDLPLDVAVDASDNIYVADANNDRIEKFAVRAEFPIITPGIGAVTEGNAGTTTLNLPVTLSQASATPITVHYATIDTGAAGVATPGVDYQATSGTLTFAPGETSKVVPIVVNGDTVKEPPLLYGEWVLVLFSNPTGATIDPRFYGLGIGIIGDDDPTPVITPGIGGVAERNGGTVTLNVPVTLSNVSATPITVHYATIDTGAAGVATPGVDYQATSGTLTFAPGETSKVVPIVVNGDTVKEPPLLYGEWVLVSFSNPTGADHPSALPHPVWGSSATTTDGARLASLLGQGARPSSRTSSGHPARTHRSEPGQRVVECDRPAEIATSRRGVLLAECDVRLARCRELLDHDAELAESGRERGSAEVEAERHSVERVLGPKPVSRKHTTTEIRALVAAARERPHRARPRRSGRQTSHLSEPPRRESHLSP